jgi:hypothetical protein
LDTLHGYINYKNWEINPDKINFKNKDENTVSVYTPVDIKEFRASDELYVGAIVNSEISPSRTDQLKENPFVNIIVDTVFLQTIYNGDKSLYYYKNVVGKDNFYTKNDSGLQLLIYKKYLKKQNQYSNNAIVENKSYLGQLALYLSDCSIIQSKLSNTAYTQKSLEGLFKYYYTCAQSEPLFQKTREKVKTEFGILAGVSISSLAFKGSIYPYLKNADFSYSTNPTAGLFLDIILPRNLGKWSIKNELMFHAYKVDAKYNDFVSVDQYTIYTTEIGYSYMKLNTLLHYKYLIGKTYFYLNGGMSNGLAIDETNYKKTETKFYVDERTEEDQAVDYPRQYEQAFIIGLGAQCKKFSIEMRYLQGNGMASTTGSNTISKSYIALLGYRFK